MPSEAQTPGFFSVPDYARTTAYDMYPGQRGQDDQQDAARHMLASATLARKYGPEWAERLGRFHEYKTSPLAALKMALGLGEMPPDYAQDIHNNRIGAEIGAKAGSQSEIEDLIQALAERSATKQTKGRPWINKSKGGVVSSAATEARAALRMLRDRLAAKESLLSEQRAMDEARYTRDIQPLQAPTDEQIDAELLRRGAGEVRKSKGGLTKLKECSCHG